MTIKRLTEECEHEFETVTNLYGRIIQEFISSGVIYRSLAVCKKCSKRSKSTQVDKACNVKNKPCLW